MKRNCFCRIIMVLLGCMLLVACAAAEDDSARQPVKNLKLENDSVMLMLGGDETLASAQIVPVIEPEDASNKECIFSSADESVATVDQSGKVYGVGPGKTKISVVSAEPGSNQKAVCKVTVGSLVTEIKMNVSEQQIKLGDSVSLKPETLPAGATNPKLNWESSNPDVVTVDGKGKVKAISPGKAEIQCVSTDGGNVSASCAFTVCLPVDKSVFRDKNFLNYVAENLDPDHDGLLTPEEVEAIEKIEYVGNSWDTSTAIKDLSGIENFRNLTELDVSFNRLSKIDLHGNLKLEKLKCNRNALKSIDLSYLPELQELCVGGDYTSINKNSYGGYTFNTCLQSVNLGENPNLISLDIFEVSKMTSLDLSCAPGLKSLKVESLPITDLDLSKNPELEVLHLMFYETPGITNLSSLEYNPNLREIRIYNNVLTNLNLQYCQKLTDLNLSCYALADLDLSNCSELKKLFLQCNYLSSLDLSHNDALTSIEIYQQTQFDTLDIHTCSNLETLELQYSNISNVIFPADCSSIKRLVSCQSSLWVEDCSPFPNLEYLEMSYNNIPSLDVTQNPKLMYLNVAYGKFDTIDLSHNPLLKEFWCYYSNLVKIDMSNNPDLEVLGCFECEFLIELDISKNTKLRNLSARDTPLTEINLTGCPILIELVRTGVKQFKSVYECWYTGTWGYFEDKEKDWLLQFSPNMKLIIDDELLDPTIEE